MKIIFFVILFVLTKDLSGQVLRLKEYGLYVSPTKCMDTITEELRDNRTIKIYLYDCKGEMRVEIYSGNKIVEKGTYINSLDTLKGYSLEKDLRTGDKKITVESYFEPLRNGEWVFSDTKKRINIIKHYDRGIELRK